MGICLHTGVTMGRHSCYWPLGLWTSRQRPLPARYRGCQMPNRDRGWNGVGLPFLQHLPYGLQSPEGTMTMPSLAPGNGRDGLKKAPPCRSESHRVAQHFAPGQSVGTDEGWLGVCPGRRLRRHSGHIHPLLTAIKWSTLSQKRDGQSLLLGASGRGRCSRHTTLTGSVAWSSSRRAPRSPVWLYCFRAGWSTVTGMLKFRCG